jgi:hypothetical protein
MGNGMLGDGTRSGRSAREVHAYRHTHSDGTRSPARSYSPATPKRSVYPYHDAIPVPPAAHTHRCALPPLSPHTRKQAKKTNPRTNGTQRGGNARKKPNLVAAIVLFFSSFDGSVFLFFFQRVSTSSTFAIPSAIFYFLISYIFLKKKPLSMLADNDERLVICRMILIVVRTFKCRV